MGSRSLITAALAAASLLLLPLSGAFAGPKKAPINLPNIGAKAGPDEVKIKPPAPKPVRDARGAWLQLGDTKNGCEGEYVDFKHGGLRSLTCHLASKVTAKALTGWARAPIFLKGPHTVNRFNLHSPKDFGHYNPKFVKWAVDHLAPGVKDAKFRAQTQALYDSHLKRYAAGLYITYKKLAQERGCFDAQVKDYTAWIAGKKTAGLPYSRYYYFLNPKFCDNATKGWRFFHDHGGAGKLVDGHLTSACTAWWIRRTIDGTAAEWWRGIDALVKAYDPVLAGTAKAQPKPLHVPPLKPITPVKTTKPLKR